MVTIKEIEADSLAELNELYRELTGSLTDPGKLAEAFATIKADSRYILLGAYVDGELLGSMMGIVCQDLVGDCRPFMVIENVVVSSRARRQGLGKQLMDAIEKIAHERDCYYIILVSGEKRKEAHVFYEKMGYRDEKVEGYRKHLSSH
ncbi:GNAT family N-acetyltransferase [Paenibacillus typhae]|uniref:Ribosomal protein S18 acetylase RimI n=1 Tax=Paenibacillus typhae TaxID=1174501 RepID=A0A1G9B5L7_9BACL|nr:GNAT family N-acetyltransferase [Paenibacillus typhae]SDK34390.1 Ribosomal protein S18 acetylase RimI [Paenibacillus typhae]